MEETNLWISWANVKEDTHKIPNHGMGFIFTLMRCDFMGNSWGELFDPYPHKINPKEYGLVRQGWEGSTRILKPNRPTLEQGMFPLKTALFFS
jgi:hypothetical protein